MGNSIRTAVCFVLCAICHVFPKVIFKSSCVPSNSVCSSSFCGATYCDKLKVYDTSAKLFKRKCPGSILPFPHTHLLLFCELILGFLSNLLHLGTHRVLIILEMIFSSPCSALKKAAQKQVEFVVEGIAHV